MRDDNHFFKQQQQQKLAQCKCAPTLNKRRHLFLFLASLQLAGLLQAASGQRRDHQNHDPHSNQNQNQMSPIGALQAPPLLGQQLPFMLGPAVDLVSLNRRLFEMGHQHQIGSSEPDMKRAELLESKLVSMPELVMAKLPDEMNRQILETVAQEASINLQSGASTAANLAALAQTMASLNRDPDSASIERLSKSCLTVHASSSRPEDLNVTFLLFTRKNPHLAYRLGPQVSRSELIGPHSPFDFRKPLKWITHGFHTNVDKSEWMVEAKDRVLANEDSNVILTDWRRGASPALAFYPKAAANAHVVAKLIVKILRRIRQDIDLSRVHLIGHSLGAHIMGFVGSAFTEEFLHRRQQQLQSNQHQQRQQQQQVGPHELGQLIGRITACDPALPCFGPTSSAPSSHQQPQQMVPVAGHSGPSALTVRAGDSLAAASSDQAAPSDWTPTMWTHLRPDSAVLVEVMHSNPGVMGYADPLGDYDFYPNGFERQPGCGSGNQEESGGRQRRQLGFLFGLSSSQQQQQQQQQQPQGPTGHLEKLIKPIRDFFQGYTCSHHRSVEYMVESMYYDRRPGQCQMVGYRCSDYAAFKRGFCFQCQTEGLDCRTFTMDQAVSARLAPVSSSMGRSLGSLFSIAPTLTNSTSTSTSNSTEAEAEKEKEESPTIRKRALPTFDHRQLDYRAASRNKYFFDTRDSKDYCAHHYHLLIKYRWFRVRDGLQVDGLRLVGQLASLTLSQELTFNRLNYQSYTALISDAPAHLGPLQALHLFGDRLKASVVEHVEVTYMSHLDARQRQLSSARLCRQPLPVSSQQQLPPLPSQNGKSSPSSTAHLFLPCSGTLV